METWFLEKAHFCDQTGIARKPDESIQKGDTFIWKWNNWDFDEKGEILEANGKSKVSFTFGNGGIVQVELTDFNSSTEVVFTKEKIPTDEKKQNELLCGMFQRLDLLDDQFKSMVGHGVLLHATGIAQQDTPDLVNS